MIYAILAKYDYTQPTIKTFSQKGVKWLHEIELTRVDRMSMDAYLESIAMTKKQNAFEVEIAAISNNDKQTRLLMTIPGINYDHSINNTFRNKILIICNSRETSLSWESNSI